MRCLSNKISSSRSAPEILISVKVKVISSARWEERIRTCYNRIQSPAAYQLTDLPSKVELDKCAGYPYTIKVLFQYTDQPDSNGTLRSECDVLPATPSAKLK